MKKKKRLIVWGAAVIILAVLAVWTLWANTALTVTYVTVSSGRLPEAFSGMKIAHVSDLHNAQFGNDNEKLIKILKDSSPDIIVITGDLIDSQNTDIDTAVRFAEQAVDIAPVYYVTGNHESWLGGFDRIEHQLEKTGVTVLRDESLLIEKDGEYVSIVGVDDPDFVKVPGQNSESDKALVDGQLKKLCNGEYFTILLSHRPELFEVYVRNGVDLVLSGHAHGGQFRLPIIGGVAAPDQGLFPKYDSGLYTSGSTNMIVSRGLGNSRIPLRINNRPEVIIITLECE